MYDLFTKGRAVGLHEAGMSVRDVAERIGVNNDTVRRWIAGFQQTCAWNAWRWKTKKS